MLQRQTQVCLRAPTLFNNWHSVPEFGGIAKVKNKGVFATECCWGSLDDGTAAYPPQVGSGYKAFWLRDYAYILEGGAVYIPPSELLAAVSVFLNAQRADGACVDFVKYDGTPIHKPGYGSMG